MNQEAASNSKLHCAQMYKRAQRGVGLIEVLIALLVLSIGVLGIAALQTRALSDNGSSLNRSVATAATYSIIEAMRLDRANAITNAYDGTVTADDCPDVGTTLKDFQLSRWCTDQLGANLGSVSTTMGIINCAANLCTITIQFDEGKTTGGNARFQLITTAAI